MFHLSVNSILLSFLLATVIRSSECLVCYDSSSILRHSSATIPGPMTRSSIYNNCKICLTLTVTQTLDGNLNPDIYPINMTRGICSTSNDVSCETGSFYCPDDDSVFQQPQLILSNKPVRVRISENALKNCFCCDSDFCNGPKPNRDIPCNVTSPISAEEASKCVGCIVDKRTTWNGYQSEVTRCLNTGCENYESDCLPCDANNYEKCSCTCSINFPKIGKYKASFVTPNIRPSPSALLQPSSNPSYTVHQSGAPASCHYLRFVTSFISLVIALSLLFL